MSRGRKERVGGLSYLGILQLRATEEALSCTFLNKSAGPELISSSAYKMDFCRVAMDGNGLIPVQRQCCKRWWKNNITQVEVV